MKILKSAIIGILAGFITGFFSAGGGMIILPAIIYFFNLDERKARGTTIFIILPLVLIASFFYYKGNESNLILSLKCVFGGIIGGYVGSKLLRKIPENLLRILFIVFLLYASYTFIMH